MSVMLNEKDYCLYSAAIEIAGTGHGILRGGMIQKGCYIVRFLIKFCFDIVILVEKNDFLQKVSIFAELHQGNSIS